MSEEEIKKEDSETREFTENPFDHQNARPEDVVRLFYLHDVPIIPVISKRGVLIGIIRKQNIISELSDIERVEKLKIDEFITRNAVKMTLDDLLPFGKIKEFVVINIFGEPQGTWSRIQLFNACEASKGVNQESEVKKQQEDQVLDWMIYLILEHIPRGLYAVNEKGRTIFYNSNFEDLYLQKYGEEVNVEKLEQLFSDPLKNELYSNADENDLFFYNTELDTLYEKIPLYSSDKKSGYLIFCDKKGSISAGLNVPGVDLRNKPLNEVIEAVERQLIVEAIRKGKDLQEAADTLQLTKQSLNGRIKKFGIETSKS